MRLAIPLLLVGCADSAPTWYGDVQPIVEGRCTGCHAAGAIGGFGLESYEEAAPLSGTMAQAVEEGRMPPWPASDAAEYDYDWQLTDEQYFAERTLVHLPAASKLSVATLAMVLRERRGAWGKGLWEGGASRFQRSTRPAPEPPRSCCG